jgi:cobalt/nickel transport system permease protein
MHIPDGYLSPSTSAVFYAASAPFIARALKKAKQRLDNKTVPLVSLFSATSFVVMMFNVPLPGGTTGHAVGSVIAAIVLGPWIAILSTTVALIIQALFFGDGGILTLGANIFNMAIVMPLVGYAVYHFLDRWSNGAIRRKVIFSAIAGYIAINLAGFLVGVELGIQPILFHNNAGQSLYFPYSLNVAIPAMMLGHLTIAGIAEALVTGLTLSWIYRTNPSLMTESKKVSKKESKLLKRGLIALGILVVLSPLGLLAPGTAWGEWGREELQNLGLGYIPTGFDTWSTFWKAPIPDYDLPQLGNTTIAYIFSGITGVLASFFLIWGIFWMQKKISGNNTAQIYNHRKKNM